MNIVNMHQAVQQGVDKINSLQADMLLSEEIDVELNKSQDRFINTKYGINNRYNKGFEESQKRVDDLRTLVTEYSNTVTYKEQYGKKTWVDTFKLPPNYLYLVSQRSEVLRNKTCTPISFTITQSGSDITYFKIPMSNLHDGGTTFVKRMRMVADVTNPLLGDVPMLSLGDISLAYTYPADINALQNDILDPNNWNAGFKWYLNTFEHLNFPGHFIVTVDTNVHPWVNYDASVTNAVSGVNTITKAIGRMPTATGLDDPINTTTDVLYDDSQLVDYRTLNDSEREFTLNKFVQHDDISKLIEDPFNTTKYTSPLTTIRGDYIDLYTSDIFIIDKVKITYIRKPQKISLSLGVDCELPEHCHQEIVDMTVSSILEGIGDPRYKTHQLEVSKNE